MTIKCASAACLLLTILICGGCASATVSENAILSLNRGASLAEVRAKLGMAARHEFTVAQPDGAYTALGCYLNPPGGDLLLMFRNQILVKIVAPVPPPVVAATQLYQGRPVQVQRVRGWDIEDTAFVTKTIHAPALTRDQIIAYGQPYRGQGMDPMAILPAVIIVTPLAVALAPLTVPVAVQQNRANTDLIEKYDGCRARLGMTAAEIDTLYGPPQQTYPTASGGTARIYGPDTQPGLVPPEADFQGLAVVTDAKGIVTAIYSDGFFLEDWRKVGAPASASITQK